MKPCQRCGGQMFLVWHYDTGDKCCTWDCIQCGESIDIVILENRKASCGMQKRKVQSANIGPLPSLRPQDIDALVKLAALEF